MRAMDNPSPPPSPTLPLSFFDPYHTTTPESLTDYQNDLRSLSMSNHPERDDHNPLLLATTIYSRPQTSGSHLPNISFLPHCPIPVKSPQTQQTFEIPDLIVAPPLENLLVESVTVVDLTQKTRDGGEDSDIVLHNSEPQTGQLSVGHVLPQPSNFETPVRRSPRPRMSVTPNLAPPPAVFLLPSSSARTQIKKKLTIDTFDEIVDDSKQKRDLEEETIQPALFQTHSALSPIRQRSPTRSPISFDRVLGSLSPKSTDLLSRLAFIEEPNNVPIGDAKPSADSQIPLASSMFPPLPESVPPKTSSRSTGPIRFSSPMRFTSSHKMRLQAPAPNDPTNTPARRIPIEQGITQGHVSPQKATQLGFRSDGTPLTFLQTPARRVLVSEQLTTPVTRPGGSRFGSPSTGKERERSLEPSSRLVVKTDKERERSIEPSSRPVVGKEKQRETLAKSSSVQRDRLPYPLVASNPMPSTSLSRIPEICQGDLPQEKPVNVKSSLRQPTSRIPRIGTKPYARPSILRTGEKDPSTLPMRTVDLTKVNFIDC